MRNRPRKTTTHRQLEVFTRAFDVSALWFKLSKRISKEETHSLTDQLRRSSRCVCSNLAEAWRRRRHEAAFVAKFSDCEAEAVETQVWIKYAVNYGYLDSESSKELSKNYSGIILALVGMLDHSDKWILN
jgi:four helix bundle protein